MCYEVGEGIMMVKKMWYEVKETSNKDKFKNKWNKIQCFLIKTNKN